MERTNYVFNEVPKEMHQSRNVELRLKSACAESDARTFSIELATIQLGSNEDQEEGDPRRRILMGTYVVARDITDRKQADELITYQAYHDILTELPNRALFKDRLGLALLQARRNDASLALR